MLCLGDIGFPSHTQSLFFEKVIRLQRAQEGDSGSISFAAFRLYEPKSREGVLGPDLRVLILLEYPGVSPGGTLGKCPGERSGRAEGLPKVGL